MQLSQRELVIILVAIQTTGKTNPMGGGLMARTFPVAKGHVVGSVFEQIESFTDEKGQIKEGDHKVNFETSEKALILECIKDREWQAADYKWVGTVIEKLEKPVEEKAKKVPEEK